MTRLVDAAMIYFAKNGHYLPKERRRVFNIKVMETSCYTVEIIADCSDSAQTIANKIFKVNRSIFEKECSVKTTDCNVKRRVRQSFSRFDP